MTQKAKEGRRGSNAREHFDRYCDKFFENSSQDIWIRFHVPPIDLKKKAYLRTCSKLCRADADGDGLISREEWFDVLTKAGKKVTR